MDETLSGARINAQSHPIPEKGKLNFNYPLRLYAPSCLGYTRGNKILDTF